MKRNLLAVFALVLAVGFSAFTTKHMVIAKKTAGATHWFQIISPTGGEKTYANYSDLGTTQPSDCFGNNSICIVQVDDVTRPGGGAPDNVVDQADFDFVVAGLDTNSDGQLSDQTENVPTLMKQQ